MGKPTEFRRQNIYYSKLPLDILQSYNPFYIPISKMDGRLSLGRILVNGHRYLQVDSLSDIERSPETCLLSYDSLNIFFHFDDRLDKITIDHSTIELTVRERLFSFKKRG